MLQRITHRKKNYVEFVKSKKKGLSTGFPSLDNLLYGLQPGYHILAARPSVGKTSFALNIAIQVAIAKKKPLFFSLEMTESQFMERLVSYLTGVSPMDLRTNNIKEDHKEAVDNVDKIINDMDMYVDYTSKHSAGSLLKQIQFLKEADGYVPDVIFVDYIQKMKTNDSRFPKNPSDYAEISRELCHISKELNIPMLVLAQLNRGADEYTSKADRKEWIPKVPRLIDLKNTGAIEEDSDTVILLHRKDYHEERENKEYDAATAPIDNATVYVAKNRHGPCGSFNLTWLPEIFKFVEIKGK